MVARPSGVFLLSAVALTSAAHAGVSISNKPTQNMDCQAGVCTATAQKAVLNVGDLQGMLASGDVTVKTGSLANSIEINDPLTWASTSGLTLDAQSSIIVRKPVVVAGMSALTVTTNDGGAGGDLFFERDGKIDFSDLSSSLRINGVSYVLVGDIKALADNIATNPSGSYAFAIDYDATADGHYKHSPISGPFDGVFEGLNHRISNLTIHARDNDESAGLFQRIESDSRPIILRDIHFINVDVSSAQQWAGALAGLAFNVVIFRCYSSGKVEGAAAGGLVGAVSPGTIVRSGSDAEVTVNGSGLAGGLVGWARETNTTESFATGPVTGGTAGGLAGANVGEVQRSYATGPVTGNRGKYSFAGGLLGSNGGDSVFSEVVDSYATGAVTNRGHAFTGGLVGYSVRFKGQASASLTATSYSTGQVQGRNSGKVGGFAGEIDGAQTDYWDITTSGSVVGVAKGCGGKICQANVTGLTDDQLNSGLPTGFDPNVWGQSPNMNNGYPYLLANPPQ
jgi:hypothetical protein